MGRFACLVGLVLVLNGRTVPAHWKKALEKGKELISAALAACGTPRREQDNSRLLGHT